MPAEVRRNSSIVLMARIEDRFGATVGTSDVEAIRYSIYELDPHRPDSTSIVDGREDIAVDVREVIRDSLMNGHEWALDAIGYNFRHDIELDRDKPFPKQGVSYQILYELTPTVGEKTIARFHLAAA